MNELKPCPICAGKKISVGATQPFSHKEYYEAYVACIECDLILKIYGNEANKAINFARQKWNQRRALLRGKVVELVG